MAYLANNEELQSSLSNVPSSNLNDLMSQFGMNQYPAGMMPATSSISTQNSTDVIHTSSLNLAQSIEIGQLPHTTMTTVNEANKSPSIDVVIENRMVRFRYDSELNNRNYGKEVLAKIVVYDYTGRVKVRIHAVDDKKFRAHPFCLIGDKCVDGVYIEEHDIAPDKNECICKATPRIPKQKNYDMELNNRKKIMMDPNRFPFITSDMEKDDYWSSNKNIKESKEIILMVEVYFSAENTSLGTSPYLFHHSNPINNAKDGKKFEVYAISPLTSSVLGSPNDSHFIILTADSYSPAESDIEVRFCDEGNWRQTTTGKVIKNAIEFLFPGYSDALSVNKTVYVSVYDKKRKIETSKKELTLLPSDGDILAHKRKKIINFTIGDYKEGVKQEQRSSCNIGGQRRIHHLKKKPPSQSGSPLDLAKLEEEGLLSLNISSPMSQNEYSQNSTSNSSFGQPATSATFSNFNNPSTTLAGSIPNTIPAILAPSGARDMQPRSTISDYQLGANGSDNKDLANNVAFSQNSQENILQSLSNLQVVGNNTQDISQEQTLSISQLNNLLQYPDILKLLGLNADGSAPQTASAPSGSFNQMNTDQFANSNAGYDPHDIRLEDLVDEMSQNDIEVDCEEISSSTGKEESCEKCKNENDKSEQKKEKDISSSKKSKGKVSKKKLSEKKTESKDEKSEIQSAVISSNVDSDVEEG
ncbi:Hypothetical predicted protein [Mytilus galloprovincialis]|uniref:RHD domain-containing protein n=1 Tax=Mytilus galloprovincialis TaxID=29158 RepID=A0A8B6GYV6_MYTGA|nr:Hypothetical predicted protein [Mytilus galloprovincialis]